MLNKLRIIVTLIVTALLLTACSDSDINSHLSYKLNFVEKNEGTYPAEISSEIINQQGESFDEENQINKDNIFDIHKNISQFDLVFSDIDIYKSKNLPAEISKEEVMYYDTSIDENGTLTIEATYFFITMNVSNTSEKDIRVCWNRSEPILINEYYYPIGIESLTSWEAHYRSGRTDITKDYYIDTLKAGSEVKITIGFIIDDNYINEDNLYYSPGKCVTDRLTTNKELKFYKI